MGLTPVNEDPALDCRYQEWIDWDRNEKTRGDIEKLKREKKTDELKKRLLQRMEFGTAGLRARMGAGFSMMNDLTIIQTSQGLLKCLESRFDDLKDRGIVVGYDGRENSQRFAWLVACIFIQAGVKVYLFSDLCPTPYVAYGVRRFNTVCGVMVTASHNPKEDNGYKVYWDNGAQIVSPIDKCISNSISDNLEPWPSSWDTDIVDSSSLRVDPLQETLKGYNSDLTNLICFKDSVNDRKCSVRFTYTAMHGVGYKYILEAVKVFGYPDPVPVTEQVYPDPEFPTVKYPNPEEGKGALKLAMKTADENESCVILANDPDADRLAVAEKLPSGEWRIFTGNELGALFGWWSWFCYKEKHPNSKGDDVYMLSSTVSSKILKTMAEKEGFKFEETLTGFKWMGNLADNLKKKENKTLFAFEEAIGFMCGDNVLDKDGISSACVMSELTNYLYDVEKTTLSQRLEKIYTDYGFHLSSNSYFICHHPPTISEIFHNLRNYGAPNQYPKMCGKYPIKHIRDLTEGYDSSTDDLKPRLPVDKSSHMITYTFENGCVVTIRTSGTEPKIKYYTEHCPLPGSGLRREDAQRELDEIVIEIVKHFLQAEKYKLIPKSD